MNSDMKRRLAMTVAGVLIAGFSVGMFQLKQDCPLAHHQIRRNHYSYINSEVYTLFMENIGHVKLYAGFKRKNKYEMEAISL